jgi:hypothetical protein
MPTFAERLSTDLQAKGMRCWLDSQDILPARRCTIEPVSDPGDASRSRGPTARIVTTGTATRDAEEDSPCERAARRCSTSPRNAAEWLPASRRCYAERRVDWTIIGPSRLPITRRAPPGVPRNPFALVRRSPSGRRSVVWLPYDATYMHMHAGAHRLGHHGRCSLQREDGAAGIHRCGRGKCTPVGRAGPERGDLAPSRFPRGI